MAEVKKVSYRRCKDDWTRIAVPRNLLRKRHMEVKVAESDGTRAHTRIVERWMPIWDVHLWLNENIGNEKWKMDHRTREIAVRDDQVAFLFKLRWA